MTTLRFFGHRPPGIVGEAVPGRLVVLEGTDGAGRSTQIGLLKEWLEREGYGVFDTGLRRSQLAGAAIGRAKRGHTLDPMTLSLLYATDFWDRVERQIFPALRAGMVVLADRYFFTLIARAVVRGVPARWMQDLYEVALVPDRVLYLDIDVEHLAPRVLNGKGLNHWESGRDFQCGGTLYESFVAYQSKLLAQFEWMSSHYGFTVVDGRRTVAEVFRVLRAELESVVAEMAAGNADDRAHGRRESTLVELP